MHKICWVARTAARPLALRQLDRRHWHIRHIIGGRALPEDAHLICCDHTISELGLMCEERKTQSHAAPLFIFGDMQSIARANWLLRGGDEVLSADCSTQEFSARAEIHMQRAELPLGHWRHGIFSFSMIERKVLFREQALPLNPLEYALLFYLARAGNRVVPKSELLQRVWNLDFDPGTNRIEVYIFRVRMKLAEHGGKDLIRTVKGKGYMLTQ